MSNLFNKPSAPVVAPPATQDIVKQANDQAKLNNLSLEQAYAQQQQQGYRAQFLAEGQGLKLHK